MQEVVQSFTQRLEKAYGVPWIWMDLLFSCVMLFLALLLNSFHKVQVKVN